MERDYQTRADRLDGSRLGERIRRSVNLVQAGILDVVAMRMPGHKTRSVFDRYGIVSEGDLTDAGHKLNAFMETISGTIGIIRSELRPPKVVNGRAVSELDGAEGQN